MQTMKNMDLFQMFVYAFIIFLSISHRPPASMLFSAPFSIVLIFLKHNIISPFNNILFPFFTMQTPFHALVLKINAHLIYITRLNAVMVFVTIQFKNINITLNV